MEFCWRERNLLVVEINFKIGDKVKIIKDMPSVNGMLHKDSIVKVDEISHGSPFRGSIRVVDSLGKIWWVDKDNLGTI